MSESDGGPGSGPKRADGTSKKTDREEELAFEKSRGVRPDGTSKATERAEARAFEKSKSKDMTRPDPASGPMAIGGPNGTSESLPKTVEPFSEVKDAGRDGGPGSGPRGGAGSSAIAHIREQAEGRAANGRGAPNKPSSGKDCGSAMSLDEIRSNAKRIGRY